MNFPSFLMDRQISFETLVHPPAFTAQKRAKYLRIPGKQVAKTVLLKGTTDYFLAILPATHLVDTEKLTAALGQTVRLARDDEAASLFVDCEWGVVPPFGTLYGLSTILEESIHPDTLMVFEGNRRGEAIRMRCHDFEQLEQPRRLSIIRR